MCRAVIHAGDHPGVLRLRRPITVRHKLQVLALLPDQWTLSLLDRFLPQALRFAAHMRQHQSIVKNLYRARTIQLRAELARLRSTTTVIQENRYGLLTGVGTAVAAAAVLTTIGPLAVITSATASARYAGGILMTLCLRGTPTAPSCT